MFLVDPAAMEDFQGVETKDPNCVVVGLAPTCFTYENLTKAFRQVAKTLQTQNIITEKFGMAYNLQVAIGRWRVHSHSQNTLL